MEIAWTGSALSDLTRLYDFISAWNEEAANRVMHSIIQAADRLLEQPRLGELCAEFEPRKVRRVIVGRYEMRYEIKNTNIYILRLWHTKEKR